ncbi:MAG: hypothetical protein MHM6MM_003569 [Cercozoa sp. M6MM]
MQSLDEDLSDTCAICQGEEDGGDIVYCDGCDVAVHVGCYGFPLSHKIPDGDWFCDECAYKRDFPEADLPKCSLCPHSHDNAQAALGPRCRRGVMKRTSDGRWAHLLCSFWVPEVFYLLPNATDVVDITRVPEARFQLTCHFCRQQQGACIECCDPQCDVVFHVPCGLDRDCHVEWKQTRAGPDVIMCYCATHWNRWQQRKHKRRS